MTEKAYLTDAYLRETEATVIRASPPGEPPWVVLDRTILYAESGGQVSDHGTLSWDQGAANVIESRNEGDDVVHYLDPGHAVPHIAQRVRVQLDWDRRFNLMCYHTAIHVLCGVIAREWDAAVTGGQLHTDRARVDVDFGDKWGPDVRDRLESLVNAEIARDRKVTHRTIPRAEFEARSREFLRTKDDLVDPSLTAIRLTDIEGLDVQADGGTHVHSLGELGRFRIAKAENKGRGHRRLTVELDLPE